MAYDPDLIAAIRAAREDLYACEAARRRVYLLTGLWLPQIDPATGTWPPGTVRAPPLPVLAGDDPAHPATHVDMARADLDAARELARASVVQGP